MGGMVERGARNCSQTKLASLLAPTAFRSLFYLIWSPHPPTLPEGFITGLHFVATGEGLRVGRDESHEEDRSIVSDPRGPIRLLRSPGGTGLSVQMVPPTPLSRPPSPKRSRKELLILDDDGRVRDSVPLSQTEPTLCLASAVSPSDPVGQSIFFRKLCHFKYDRNELPPPPTFLSSTQENSALAAVSPILVFLHTQTQEILPLRGAPCVVMTAPPINRATSALLRSSVLARPGLELSFRSFSGGLHSVEKSLEECDKALDALTDLREMRPSAYKFWLKNFGLDTGAIGTRQVIDRLLVSGLPVRPDSMRKRQMTVHDFCTYVLDKRVLQDAFPAEPWASEGLWNDSGVKKPLLADRAPARPPAISTATHGQGSPVAAAKANDQVVEAMGRPPGTMNHPAPTPGPRAAANLRTMAEHVSRAGLKSPLSPSVGKSASPKIAQSAAADAAPVPTLAHVKVPPPPVVAPGTQRAAAQTPATPAADPSSRTTPTKSAFAAVRVADAPQVPSTPSLSPPPSKKPELTPVSRWASQELITITVTEPDPKIPQHATPNPPRIRAHREIEISVSFQPFSNAPARIEVNPISSEAQLFPFHDAADDVHSHMTSTHAAPPRPKRAPKAKRAPPPPITSSPPPSNHHQLVDTATRITTQPDPNSSSSAIPRTQHSPTPAGSKPHIISAEKEDFAQWLKRIREARD
ncbi:hypothetical protein BDK51DRAFT_47558 [Blyttiomyces helicus]|uniref:Uncharacterized protein n=1 Tax=Blyttiomyces helicus TaxID=388810 RepID=A0A4P9WLD9_9FUNG|nr:hypothetical protein BDK51DRAFT_47558 [Blyttiomyces helicus]|eukprot:RKO92893.1 hypothetical protein BDK51DRAFT_47558 [Blyttiomyces helicus]